ncbi:MAG: sterol desaturase family protein [Azospirillaceae bacterium]
MDDTQFGRRDRRGDWAPNEALTIAPIWRFPPDPRAILRWLPGYFFPWNILFALSAVAYWAWVIPPVETMQTLAWGWALRLYAVNAVAVFVFYGAFELWLYVRRAQGTRFKFNAKFPADHSSDVFRFRSQTVDSMLRTFLSGVTIWTAIEVVVLWVFANGWAPWLSFAQNPFYLAAFALLVPVIHEFHFFCIHRLIHVPFLYRWVHSVHHNSINPSPWSSLAMHPVEHLLYLSTMAYHLVLPSNPLLALYQLHFAGFGAIPGHVGFHKMLVGEGRAIDSHAYTHYLHHKYFEVNYGDGLLPLDKIFGTWHDGTKESDERMKARFRKKKERLAAAKGATRSRAT